MVDDREIKCYEYIEAIKSIQKYTGMGLYNLDEWRTRVHDELCKLFGLSKEITTKYTNNINLSAYRPAEDLYCNLMSEIDPKFKEVHEHNEKVIKKLEKSNKKEILN
jgi:hypothetical protein